MNGVNYHYDEAFNEVVPVPINQNKYSISAKEHLIRKETKESSGCGLFEWIITSFCLAFGSLVIFEIVLTIKLETGSSGFAANFTKIIIPLELFCLLIMFSINGYLAKSTQNYTKIGRFFIIFTYNSVLLLFMMFILLFSLKLDENISGPFGLIFTPLYLSFVVLLIFLCFIFPGLLDKEIQMYSEAFFITAYLIVYIITVVLLTFKLDEVIDIRANYVFLGFYLLLAINMGNLLSNWKTKKGTAFKHSLLLFLLFMSVFALCSKKDKLITYSWTFAMIPLGVFTFYVFVLGLMTFINAHKK